MSMILAINIEDLLESMRENGSPAPIFDFDDERTYFRVTLPVHPECVATASERLRHA